jgi:hypothetical protein
MKYPSVMLAVILIFYGCRGNDRKDASGEVVRTLPPTVSIVPETPSTDMHYLWEAAFDSSSGKMKMIKSQPLPPDSLHPGFILHHLNALYPEVRLVLEKISNDTIFVKINKSQYLTEQMGSSGADLYLTEVTYDLSELSNIRYVHFDFKEGDHASPGTYSKTDFVNVLK